MISCEDCGVCCTKPFNLTNNGKRSNYAFVGTVHGQRVRHCKEFDRETKKCKIYDERPQLCEDYLVGGKECLSRRELFNLNP